MRFGVTLHTNGKGFWSREAREVRVTRISCRNEYYQPDIKCAELRVYFTKGTWDIAKHGLIYSDPRFLRELRAALKAAGLKGHVDYTEQGMQGRDYVSFDVSLRFVSQLKARTHRW